MSSIPLALEYKTESSPSTFHRIPWFNNTDFVKSLYGKLYVIMMNTSILNPSTREAKVVKMGTSINDTIINALKEDPDLFGAKRKTSKLFWAIHVPLAAVGRIALCTAMSCSVAPLGILINGSITLFFVVKVGIRGLALLTAKKVAEGKVEEFRKALQQDCKSLKNYAIGLGTDALMALPGACYFAISCGVIDEITLLGSLIPAIVAFSPKKAVSFIADESKRVGLLKAILLKEIGVQGSWGELLTANDSDDETMEGQGAFYLQYLETTREMVNLLYSYKARSDKQNLTIPHWNYLMALSDISGKKKEICVEFEKQLIEFAAKTKMSQSEVEEIKVLFNRFMVLRRFVKELLECRGDDAILDFLDTSHKVNVGIPKFFDHQFVNKGYAGFKDYNQYREEVSKSPWDTIVEASCKNVAKEVAVKLDNPVPAYQNAANKEAYKTFRSNVLAHKKPHEILGLEADANENDFKLRYRKLAMLLHPDKLPPHSEASAEEAACLFVVLNAAFERITSTTVKYNPNVG